MVSQVRDLGTPGLASQVCDMCSDPELGVAVCSSCPERLRDFGTGQLHFIPHLAPRVTACPRPSRASALFLDQPLDSQARPTQHLGPGPSLCLKPSPRGSCTCVPTARLGWTSPPSAATHPCCSVLLAPLHKLLASLAPADRLEGSPTMRGRRAAPRAQDAACLCARPLQERGLGACGRCSERVWKLCARVCGMGVSAHLVPGPLCGCGDTTLGSGRGSPPGPQALQHHPPPGPWRGCLLP